MTVKDKVKALMACSGVIAKDLAIPLGVAEQTACNRISQGITKIDDLVKIVDYCEAELTITAKDGTIIKLNIDDLKK